MESPQRIAEAADLEKLGTRLMRPETEQRYGPFVGPHQSLRLLAHLLSCEDTCPVLIAEDGVGKTTTVRWLAAATAWYRQLTGWCAPAKAPEPAKGAETPRDDESQPARRRGDKAPEPPNAGESVTSGQEVLSLALDAWRCDAELFKSIGAIGLRDIVEVSALDIAKDCYYTYNLENKLGKILEGCAQQNVALFLDELHILGTSGASGADPTSTVAGLVAPHLGHGNIRAIGATTPTGWAHLQRTSAQFARAFTPLFMNPASVSDTRAMIRAMADRAKGEKGPSVSAGFVAEIVGLADALLPGRQLPGKAVDVFRELASRRLEDRRTVVRRDLIAVLGAKTGLRPELLDCRRRFTRRAVHRELEHQILGQAEAVGEVAQHVAAFRARLADPALPAARLLFVGPSGVGKTELAKQTARLLFGSDRHFLRFDMSEFRTAESLERLLGSTDQRLRQPSLVESVNALSSAVVLFDEIEKAPPLVWNLLLQILSDGARLTGVDGTSACFRNCFVIMTSNVGADLYSASRVGFDATGCGADASVTALRRRLFETFSPEFLSRVAVVYFRPLTADLVRRIARIEIEKYAQRLQQYGRVDVVADDDVLDRLAAEGFDPELGARPMQRTVDRLIGTALADLVNDGGLRNRGTLRLSLDAGSVLAAVEPGSVVRRGGKEGSK